MIHPGYYGSWREKTLHSSVPPHLFQHFISFSWWFFFIFYKINLSYMFFHRMSQFFPHYDTDYNETFCHVLSNKQKLVNTKLPKIMGDNGDVLAERATNWFRVLHTSLTGNISWAFGPNGCEKISVLIEPGIILKKTILLLNALSKTWGIPLLTGVNVWKTWQLGHESA